MTLHLWLAAPLAHALGLALAHFLWQGALLAAVLRVTLFLGAERPSRWRHQAAMWCLFALPLAFGITLALSLGGGHSIIAPVPAAPRMAFNSVTSQGAPGAPVDWLAWLAPLWMGGVILSFAFRLAGWVRVDRMCRRGVCAAPAEWQQRLHALAAAVRISRPVVLLESCLAGVPLVIGYWRPVILMPLGALAGLSAEQVEAILIHELAHIRRADYLVSMAQSLIEGLFFFHPAVWWISAVVRAEREYACDDVVVALRPDARAYAAALATLEQSRWPAVEAAAASNGGNLVKRIRRLLREPAPARVPNARVAALAGALVLVAAVAAALVAWPPAKSFAQEAPPAESAAGKQQLAKELDQARRNLQGLEDQLARKQKEIQDAQQTVEQAQDSLRSNAEALDRALRNGAGHQGELSQVEEQMRRVEAALKQLETAQAGKSQQLLQQEGEAIRQAESQLQQARKAAEEAQAGNSQELLQQQERAVQQARKQLQELASGKLNDVSRQLQQQLAQAGLVLQEMQGVNGERAELEKQFQQVRKELERLSESSGQKRSGQIAQAQPAEAPRSEAKTESESVYQKWLNEHVAYIITAEERRDFLALQTDADRDQFIERFWERRNPTPGAASNAFKEEHYRRLAYANEHFASSITGWRTDRGRIYIMYGPPDEIEDHPTRIPPRQVWRYTHIEGLGYDVEVEFTDPGWKGDFHMTAAPASHGSYWQLMVSASDAGEAVARSLRTGGFPILTYPVQGRPGMVQVLVGPYPDEASLAKAKTALEAAGYRPVRM
ncbi:MAG: GWxTD domain-containing protein [Bryobacteraceae bacterium]